MLRRASLLFAAGAFGAVLNVIAILILKKQGMPVPTVTLGFLYKQIAWGGLWGFAFFLPIFMNKWWARGFVIGLLPALVVLLYFLPLAGAGMFGLERSPLVPVMVVFTNAVAWGMGAAFWEKLTRA
jgi:hypothetical protein